MKLQTEKGEIRIAVDGQEIEGCVIPADHAPTVHEVIVTVG